MKQFIDDNGQEWGFDIGDAHFFADEEMTIELPAWAFSKEQIAKIVGGEPIIRCRDCKFLRLTGTVWKCQNRLVMMLCEPNDYCSRAERKEE